MSLGVTLGSLGLFLDPLLSFSLHPGGAIGESVFCRFWVRLGVSREPLGVSSGHLEGILERLVGVLCVISISKVDRFRHAILDAIIQSNFARFCFQMSTPKSCKIVKLNWENHIILFQAILT